MKKTLMIIAVLIITGCSSMGSYNKDLGVYIKTDDFDNSKTIYNRFEFSRKKLLNKYNVQLDVCIDQNDKIYVTTEVLGYHFIEKVSFRSNDIEQTVEIDYDGRTLHGTNDIYLDASWTTSYISKDNAIKILKIIKQRDCKIKVEYLNEYNVFTHTSSSFYNYYRGASESLIKIIENE